MTLAYVALGSNLENPIQQVQHAMLSLANVPHTQVLKTSSLYQTAPIGYADDALDQVPDFINAVVAVETTLDPVELLEALLAIENKAGRQRPYPNAPRVLDCDLLIYGHIELNSPQLTLPHPRMHERGFVLLPLFEIAPHLSLAKHGKIALLMNEDLLTGVKKLNA
jgi:2-amino-4-hydroxy-6-hydroxymethyldihydropteridine diphosphokinase